MMRFALGLLATVFFIGCGSSGSGPDRNDTPPPDINITDPFFAYEWHLRPADAGFASRYGIANTAHVHLGDVWRKTRGRGVTVAVIDDYFQADHPDIAANVVATYNVKTGGTDVFPPGKAKAHGLMCAGIIAAAADGQGSVGVAPEVKLMLIGSAYDTDADMIKAFTYAKEHGADVINCSWGSYHVSKAVSDVIKDVHDAGITVVFAAGNDAVDLDSPGYDDESELPWVIGVSASDASNALASYANRGSALDLLAPGGSRYGISIVSTDLTGLAGSSPKEDPKAAEWLDDNHTFFVGTSAAAPIVTGAAALLKSAAPALTPDEIRRVLVENGDDIGAFCDKLDITKAINALY